MSMLDELAGNKPAECNRKLEDFLAQIDKALSGLSDDASAIYSTENLTALAYIERHSVQEFQRIIHHTKKHGISGELKKRVKDHSRKQGSLKEATTPSFPVSSATTQTDPARKAQAGFLIDFDEVAGKQVVISESSAAVIIAGYLQGQLAYCESTHTWYLFRGTHWQPLSTETEATKALLEKIYLGTHPLGFKNNYRNNITALIIDGGLLPLPAIQKGLLPFKNGLLDTKTRVLINTQPDNAQTWVLPYNYHSEAKCPRIKKWLQHAVDNDHETVEFLRGWLAALLHGRADLQKFLHLLGRGGTGKGTFFRLAIALVGEHNTASTTLQSMEHNKFETSNFYNKRIVGIAEAGKYNGSFNTLKSLTGQDSIPSERKYQQPGNFTFDGMVIIASNENLQTTDHTSGVERRRQTVRFDNVFTENDKLNWEKAGGESALHDELPGLINWLLELSQGEISQIIRRPPNRTKKANFEAMAASNPLVEWLTECCIPDPEAWSQVGVKKELKEIGNETLYENNQEWLYANYLQWCQQHNRAPHSIRRFREILIDSTNTLGVKTFESRRGSGVGVSGLRLNKKWERPLDHWLLSAGLKKQS